jgi:hypothetical protein
MLKMLAIDKVVSIDNLAIAAGIQKATHIIGSTISALFMRQPSKEYYP